MGKRKILTALFVIIMCFGMVQPAMAQEKNLEILEMLTAEVRIEARKEPSDTAAVGKVYEAGDVLLIVEGGNKEWEAVAYQGNVYYIKKSEAVTRVPTVTVEEDEEKKEKRMDENYQEELAAQMETERHESKVFVEEYNRYLEERKQKRIWGAIIVVLMAAIFGVSLYSRFKEKRK